MKYILETFLNGNLQHAKEKAKKYSFAKWLDFLNEMGYDKIHAFHITQFLKNKCTFQELCDWESKNQKS